jgi:hypothetical protein
LCRDIFQDDGEIFELLVEMARDQQHRVFQLALVAAKRALAEIADHDGRADGDRRDQKNAAGNQPADRSAGKERFQIERAGTVCRHFRNRAGAAELRSRTLQRQHRNTSTVWR